MPEIELSKCGKDSDLSFLASPEDSWDDRIPEKVVRGVYMMTNPTRPEGEPISDFMLNGWDGLNGVADP